MRLKILAIPIAFIAGTAQADDRRVYAGNFERLRVQGPVAVTVVTGATSATVSGLRDAIEGIDVQVDGATLIVRRSAARSPGAATGPVTVALSTHLLSQVSASGGARVRVAALAGQRNDVAVTGAGTIDIAAAAGELVNVTVIGSGSVAIAGRTARGRLAVNGTGSIDAGNLASENLTVRVEGPGSVKGRAAATATVANTGLGTVAIAGPVTCTISAPAGGPVACGGPTAR